MEFTQAQLENAVRHFQTAQELMPYRTIIKKIMNDPETYNSAVDLTYEEAIANTPELDVIPQKLYEFAKLLIETVTSDPEAARAYSAMMDILEENILITAPSPGGIPFFVPQKKWESFQKGRF